MTGRFVIDNSVTMSWCFADEANPYADAILDHLYGHTAIVPFIWTLEVVNVLLAAERRKRLRQVDSLRFLTLLSALPIVVDHQEEKRMMKGLLALGRSSDLSSYDAAYLDLAMRNNCPIATLDKKLLEAANKAGVPVL
ncbi:MAG: type II toxin-antitoxin system VapC family toxin [Desulfobacteraceae bacterium]|nr:type II toxin-antitoxin system VapC family toxin [Desulfobacteraceae bacterium]